MCIVQSKQPPDRLRSLERIIQPAVLWVIATDQTVSVACMHLPTGQPVKRELSSPFFDYGESRVRTNARPKQTQTRQRAQNYTSLSLITVQGKVGSS